MSRAAAVLSLLVVAGIAGCETMTGPGPAPVPKRVQVNGAELSYVEQGQGPTVLFVHGAGQDWRAWDGLRSEVASRYRYVALSRRHHHPNAWPDDGRSYTFDQNVDDIAAFIRQLNVGKVHLVGNSYGGRLAGFVAAKYPDLLRTVVLGEASLVPPDSAEGKAAVAAYQGDLGRARTAALASDNQLAAEIVINAILADPKGYESLSPDRKQNVVDNARTMGPMFKSPPSTTAMNCQVLREFKVPALVVRGENTRDAFRHGNDQMLKCLPAGSETAVIPDARHVWALDNPSAASNAILAFLNKH
jgi:pimeloyl-ACP methyl ester carboxylesterase